MGAAPWHVLVGETLSPWFAAGCGAGWAVSFPEGAPPAGSAGGGAGAGRAAMNSDLPTAYSALAGHCPATLFRSES
jgi:hypothetical protein